MIRIRRSRAVEAAAAGGAAGGGGGRAARDGRKRPRPAAEEGEGEEDNLFRGG